MPGLTEDVLRNTRGIDNNEDLSAFERDRSRANVTELESDPIDPSFDRAHLSAIHARTFEGVYDWAGHMRDESFALPDGTQIGPMPALVKGYKEFAPTRDIDQRLEEMNERIVAVNGYKDLPPAQFASGVTGLLAELNDIHPFREGNGRTQRAFLSDLAREAGHEIDWKVIDGDRNLQASRATDSGSYIPMYKMMRDAIQPERQELLTQANDAISSRDDLEWMKQLDGMGELRKSTVLPGSSVEGVLYGVTEKAALILDPDNRMHVARLSDVPHDAETRLAQGSFNVTIMAQASHQDTVWDLDLQKMTIDGPQTLPETKQEWLEQSQALIDAAPEGARKDQMQRLLGEIEQKYEQDRGPEDGFDMDR